MTVTWNPPPSPFPDIEQVLNPWLQGMLQSVFDYSSSIRVMSETSDDLQSIVPIVRLYRITGADKAYPMIVDEAAISVDSFGADRTSASLLSRQVHTLLIAYAQGNQINGASVLEVSPVKAPGWLPYSDINVRRYNATYTVTFKTQAA